MKFIPYIFLFFLFSGSGFAQDLNQVLIDTVHNEEILIGYIDMDGITSEVFGKYYDKEYKDYTPDISAMNELLAYGANNFDYLIVLGSWCEDSHREVPRMLKVLDNLGIESEQIVMIAVDFDKNADGTNVESLNIEKVPSLLVMSGENEIGRIIETPAHSVEVDLLNILSR